MLTKKMIALVLMGTLILPAMGLWAVPITVGSGSNSANISIEWSDSYIAEFLVSFAGPTVTGLEAFDIIETATALPPISDPLTTDRVGSSFGVFIDGISQGVHSDIGFGGGENWWHFWIKDNGQSSWTSPAFGVADRILADGDSDGWVYGRAGAPIPEPATMAFVALGSIALLRRRKKCK